MIVLKNLQNTWSFVEGKPLFIACSGGLDSMVLTDLFGGFSKRVTVLHVNYHLRGEESNADEAFVRAYCELRGLRCECLSIDMEEYLEKNKGNLQEEARLIRYNWFKSFLQNADSYLLLGHHQDDQVETFYQRLARKSGIEGMGCMKEISGQVLRPLLGFQKKEIMEYARQTNLEWREDQSNRNLKYTRNRLRNEFLPFVEKQIPDLRSSVTLLIKLFQEEQQQIDATLNPMRMKIENMGRVEFSDWINLSTEQRLGMLKSIGFTAHQLDLVENLLGAQKGKQLHSATHTLIREDKYLSVIPAESEIRIPELEIKKVNTLPKLFDKQELYLDEGKIAGKLQVRPWKIGDRIASLGIKGTQLISDVISDAKIPHSMRSAVMVLTDESQIHWCIGLKVGRMALATANTKQILKITVR